MLGSGEERRGCRRLLAALVLVGSALVIPDRHGMTTIAEANTGVRVYAVQAWVHYDTWTLDPVLCRLHHDYTPIDLSVQDGTPKLQKAPGASWLGVPVYAAATTLYGDRLPTHYSLTLLGLVCVLLPVLAIAGAFGRRLQRHYAWPRATLGPVLLVAASPMAVYATLYMDYGLATMLLLAGALALRRSDRGGADPPDDRRPLAWAFLGGLLLGYAGDTNYMGWVYGALIGLIELLRRVQLGRRPYAFAAAAIAGALLPLGAVLAYHAVYFGSPFATGYSYADFELHGALGGDHPWWVMLGRILLGTGKHGLPLYAPWVLFGLVGLVGMLRRRDELRWDAATGLVLFVVSVGFTSVWQGLYKDGEAFTRHILIAFPWLAWGLVHLLEQLAGDELLPPRWGRFGRPALRGVVGATVLVGALYPFVTGWTFPHHPLQLDNPLWQLNVPLFLNGVHTPVVDWLPHREPGRAELGGNWEWVAVSAGLLVAAFATALLRRRPEARQDLAERWTGLGASAATLTLLLVAGFASLPVAPGQRSRMEQLDDALAGSERSAEDLDARTRELLESHRNDRLWYRKVGNELTGSYITPDDAAWSDEGHPETSPWCDTSSGGSYRDVTEEHDASRDGR